MRIVVDALWQAIQDFARDSVAALQPLIEAIGGIIGLFSGLVSLLQVPQTVEVDVEPVVAPDLGLFGQVEQGDGGTIGAGHTRSLREYRCGSRRDAEGHICAHHGAHAVAECPAGKRAGGRGGQDHRSDRSPDRRPDGCARRSKGTVGDGGVEAKPFRWSDYLTDLSWPQWVDLLKWTEWINPLRWLQFIPGFQWVSFVPDLSWSKIVNPLNWVSFIPGLQWVAFHSDRTSFGTSG